MPSTPLISFKISTKGFGLLLERVFGGPPSSKTADEMRWEDDGGPVRPEWEHTIEPTKEEHYA